MLDKLDAVAELSVARGCGFASIGIFTMMMGLADQMQVSLKAGGLMGLLMAVILAARGFTAMRTPYRRTEVWIMLAPADRPNDAIAQQLIGMARRQAYLRYALNTTCVSAGFLTGSLVIALFGVKPA